MEYDITKSIKKIIFVNKVFGTGIWIFTLISFVNPVFMAILTIFIVLKLYTKTVGLVNIQDTIELEQQKINKCTETVLKVANSSKVWKITRVNPVVNTKYSAGASSTVGLSICTVYKKAIFPFKSNVPAASFKTKNEILVFLPDRLCSIHGNIVNVISYSDIQITTRTTRFIEYGQVLKDTSVVGSTWKYVNKSGGPDKRFKDNRELPICLYGEIELKSTSGLNIVLMFSNADLN